MRCPFCRHPESRVIDSRASDDSQAIRRRRECPQCSRRFTTIETASLQVVKRSGAIEPFSREKIIAGVGKACQGRPVGEDDLALLAHQVHRRLSDPRPRHRPDHSRSPPAPRHDRLLAVRLRVLELRDPRGFRGGHSGAAPRRPAHSLGPRGTGRSAVPDGTVGVFALGRIPIRRDVGGVRLTRCFRKGGRPLRSAVPGGGRPLPSLHR